MVYIFTALYCEAQIFIEQFRLIKNQQTNWFQEFYNETYNIHLTITGVGEIAASAAISSVCSTYRPTQKDLLLNVGICAHTTKNNGIFLCNKIIERETGRTFYPDILYYHSFSEATLVTGMLPYNANQDNTHQIKSESADFLYDMEAAAIYQIGIHYFGPHQMIFLKIVSDKGLVSQVSKEQTTLLMKNYQNCIVDYIMHISFITQEINEYENYFADKEETLIETFCADLHCSKTMKDSMKQLIQYMSLAGMDYISIIQSMYNKNLLPCKDKREGKLRFEEFKRRLF